MSSVAAVGATLIADSLWFFTGRAYGRRLLNYLVRFSLSLDTTVRVARNTYERYGAPILTIAKFLPGLGLISAPLLGTTAISVGVFLWWDLVGATLWASVWVIGGAALARSDRATGAPRAAKRRHDFRRVRGDLRGGAAVSLGAPFAVSPLARAHAHHAGPARRVDEIQRAAADSRRASEQRAREGIAPDCRRAAAGSRFTRPDPSRVAEAADRRLLRVSQRGDGQAHRRTSCIARIFTISAR